MISGCIINHFHVEDMREVGNGEYSTAPARRGGVLGDRGHDENDL
jgi:hypothetical protein